MMYSVLVSADEATDSGPSVSATDLGPSVSPLIQALVHIPFVHSTYITLSLNSAEMNVSFVVATIPIMLLVSKWQARV